MRFTSLIVRALFLFTLAAGVALSVDGCGSSPGSPSLPPPEPPVISMVPGVWTTIVQVSCLSLKEICLVEARTTDSALQFRIGTHGDIFSPGAAAAIVAIWVDVDQNPSTPVSVNGAELDACAGPDAGLCDLGPPGANPFVLSFRLADVYTRMPAGHRSVDLYLLEYEFVPARGSGAVLQRVPASGQIRLQVR